MPVTLANPRLSTMQERREFGGEKSGMKNGSESTEIVVGLLNNMSAGAMEATERQFGAILESASADFSVRLKRFALPEILEGESGAIYRDRNYENSESLAEAGVDALIVTGREPMTADLRDEAYWASFTRVLDWAQDGTVSTIWSCLAAHAAVLYMDGIQRVKSERKHSGVYPCTRVVDHPITAGVPSAFRVPHSRWNGLREADLARCGYTVATRTESAEVDCFLKAGKSLFVFFQGHPEYQSETLLLEYRRDVGRFLRGESKSYPCIPHGYFNQAISDRLSSIERQATGEGQGEMLTQIASIFASIEKNNGWHAPASQIYRNWLEYIYVRKMAHAGVEFEALSPEPASEVETVQSIHG